MPFWRLYYYFVWATRDREPLISREIVADVHDMIVAKSSFFRGQVFAVGGIEDHVHLVVSVPPSMALSDFIARVKGSSSHWINHELKLPYRFEWQAEYGVVSFGAKQLDLVTDYVRNQRSRHAS